MLQQSHQNLEIFRVLQTLTVKIHWTESRNAVTRLFERPFYNDLSPCQLDNRRDGYRMVLEVFLNFGFLGPDAESESVLRHNRV